MDSISKTRPIIQKAQDNEWEVDEVKTDDGITITCTRGSETLILTWDLTRFIGRESSHTMHGRTVRVKNAASALRFIGEDPSVTDKYVREVKFRHIDDEDDEYEIPKRLPFDLESATDDDIFEAVGGKKIIWRDSRGNYESAYVAKRPLRIEQCKNGRGLTFCCERGFTSIYLNKIVQVL